MFFVVLATFLDELLVFTICDHVFASSKVVDIHGTFSILVILSVGRKIISLLKGDNVFLYRYHMVRGIVHTLDMTRGRCLVEGIRVGRRTIYWFLNNMFRNLSKLNRARS